MKDSVRVYQQDTGLQVEQKIDGLIRMRGCVWRELVDSELVWHGFRGTFGTEHLRDDKGQLRPRGRGGDIAHRLEEFEEFSAPTLGEFLVWAVPE